MIDAEISLLCLWTKNFRIVILEHGNQATDRQVFAAGSLRRQLGESLDCVGFELTPEQMERLDQVSEIELGFPHDFLMNKPISDLVYSGLGHRIHNHRR